ncbi:MAG: DNA-directed RNA polymerase subunit omega [Candidatus Marinimicrobia bacterium]|nr:DNA-directed RNA polymerase subunit omega [Candidatus Neomarinimicrobiota bacterium]
MGLETIKMRDLEGKAVNIYESITVMAKRARQINNIRLAEKEEILDGHEDDAEEYIVEPMVPRNTKRETKVATIALNEFLRGEIEFEYVEPMPISEDEEIQKSTGDEKPKED